MMIATTVSRIKVAINLLGEGSWILEDLMKGQSSTQENVH